MVDSSRVQFDNHMHPNTVRQIYKIDFAIPLEKALRISLSSLCIVFILNGGGGGNRTRVQNKSNISRSQVYQFLYPLTERVDGYYPMLTALLH